MKTIIFFVFMLLAAAAFADLVLDHKAALKQANQAFIVAFEKCEELDGFNARNRCRGIAKAQHTKAVEKADRVKR